MPEDIIDIPDPEPGMRVVRQDEIVIADPEQGPRTGTIPFQQELTRQGISYWLLFLFSVEILFAIGAAAGGMKLDTIKDIELVVFGPTVTLLATAIGFYFASEKS